MIYVKRETTTRSRTWGRAPGAAGAAVQGWLVSVERFCLFLSTVQNLEHLFFVISSKNTYLRPTFPYLERPLQKFDPKPWRPKPAPVCVYSLGTRVKRRELASRCATAPRHPCAAHRPRADSRLPSPLLRPTPRAVASVPGRGAASPELTPSVAPPTCAPANEGARARWAAPSAVRRPAHAAP